MSNIKPIACLKVDRLRVEIYRSREEVGRAAAADLSDYMRSLQVKSKEIHGIFAAAPSQNEMLESLIEQDGINWEAVTGFHMDEYVGIEAGISQSFAQFLKDRLFSKLPFKEVQYLNCEAELPEIECFRYEMLLKEQMMDFVAMGIGENGHIAFNDPPVADFNDERLVKLVVLDEMCRQQQVNDGCFTSFDVVPQMALTLTVPALMGGKKLFCVVPGASKAQAVFDTLTIDPINEICPASILRTHSDACLYLDQDSAAKLDLKLFDKI